MGDYSVSVLVQFGGYYYVIIIIIVVLPVRTTECLT